MGEAAWLPRGAAEETGEIGGGLNFETESNVQHCKWPRQGTLGQLPVHFWTVMITEMRPSAPVDINRTYWALEVRRAFCCSKYAASASRALFICSINCLYCSLMVRSWVNSSSLTGGGRLFSL